MEEIVSRNLSVLWDYLQMHMEPRPADCIVGFGCYDETIAVRAAELYRQGLAPKLLFSGGLGRNTRELWTRSEAERFADVALAEGVPERDILIENRSTNSAENILFTRKLLAERGIPVARILGVHKPYMERRLFAALGVYWPEVEAIVTSPRATMEQHFRSAAALGMDERTVAEVIVGDFQRIEVYAQRGYQLPQPIPEPARAAFEALVRLGYTGQLV